MSRRNDADSLRDMLDKLVLAIVRLVEIIGEAAGNVSKEFQAAHSEIPWAVIVGMRNRLAHAYFDVDLDQVWDTVKDDLPLLIVRLEKVVNV